MSEMIGNMTPRENEYNTLHTSLVARSWAVAQFCVETSKFERRTSTPARCTRKYEERDVRERSQRA